MKRRVCHINEKGKTYFQKIQNSAWRLQTLSQDLLTYSRNIQAEKILVKTDLNKILDDVIMDLSEAIKEKAAIVEINGFGTLSVIPFQFQQMMYNLISNSFKF